MNIYIYSHSLIRNTTKTTLDPHPNNKNHAYMAVCVWNSGSLKAPETSSSTSFITRHVKRRFQKRKADDI